MTQITTLHTPCTSVCAAPLIKHVSVMARIAHFARTLQQRADLARLDDAQLADIGVTRKQARAESRRAPWDVPAHWRN